MIRVGPAGWSYADWEGPIHPRPRPRGFHPLDELARVFGCVEINASFYRDLAPATVDGWLERTADVADFRYTVKLHGDFTHARERAFGTPRELEAGLERYRASLGRLLGHRQYGACLVQFPLSFRPGQREVRYLRTLLSIAADLVPVVELRHRAWFEVETLRGFERTGASLAALDLPTSPDHLPSDFEGLGPVGYLRLHGRNAAAWFARDTHRDQKYDYLYARDELEPLAEAAKRLGGRTDDTYVITNNHFSGKAVANGCELLDLIGQPPPSLPARWIAAFPDLARVAPASGDGGLFDGAADG